jgi:hypothetical protein
VTTNVPELVFGGAAPTRIEQKLGLSPRDSRRFRRVALIVLFGWVPLFPLAAIQAQLVTEGALRSLLMDFGIHSRALLATPLLILAEHFCFPQLTAMSRHFLNAGLIGDADRNRFDAAVASTRELEVSRWSRGVAVLFAYACIVALAAANPELPTWHRPQAGSASPFSPAGWWHALVSLPALLVMLLRWVWRVFLWGRLLWKLSWLDLQLVPSHPDGAAGLKFVGYSVRSFAPVGLALGTVVAGSLANGVLMHGVVLSIFTNAAIGMVVAVVLIFGAPVLVFTRPLARARFRGIHEYGVLANGVGRQFEQQWLRRTAFTESTLDTPQFSATGDLYQLVANVYAMRLVPVDLMTLLALIITSLLPLGILAVCSLPIDVIGAALVNLLF